MATEMKLASENPTGQVSVEPVRSLVTLLHKAEAPEDSIACARALQTTRCRQGQSALAYCSLHVRQDQWTAKTKWSMYCGFRRSSVGAEATYKLLLAARYGFLINVSSLVPLVLPVDGVAWLRAN